MRDLDIRIGLRAKLLRDHQDERNTLIIDEFAMQLQYARADIAVVNGMLTGYEIKSGRDSLLRLPNQQEVYSKVFDRISVVVESRHADNATKIIPEWWGVVIVSESDGKIEFVEIRPSLQNENICPLALSQLLWKDEVCSALVSLGITRGITSKPKRQLWELLASAADRSVIAEIVRACLKARTNWQSGLLRT